MSRLKKMFPYLLVCAAAFYLLPAVIRHSGEEMLMVPLLLATPGVCFVAALVYGMKNGFHLIFSLLVGAVFIPAVFIIYNYTAWIYIVIFAVAALTGNMVGRRVHAFNNKEER